MLSRVPRFTDYLTRTFGVKGREEPMSVIPDVFPGIPLVDATDVEHHFTRDEVLWAMPFVVAAGGAGTYGRAEVGCRLGYLTVIEAMVVTVGATSNCATNLATRTVTGAPNIFPTRCDSRAEVAGPPPGAYGYGAATAAVLTANLSQHGLAVNVPNILPVGVVIDGDDIWTAGCLTANIAWWVTVYGYDRPVADWERG